MTTKAIDEQMQQFWPQLQKEEKQSILTFIKSFLKNKEAIVKRPTIEEYNREIDEAAKRVKNGEFYTQEEVEKMSKDW